MRSSPGTGSRGAPGTGLRRALERLRGRAEVGQTGESEACRHLEGHGYKILCRNFRRRCGEIDIVASRDGVTVFVEVKERSGDSHGSGYEAVTMGKRRRIVRAARLYAASRGLSETALRFDVISIERAGDGATRIRHFEGAFDSEGA